MPIFIAAILFEFYYTVFVESFQWFLGRWWDSWFGVIVVVAMLGSMFCAVRFGSWLKEFAWRLSAALGFTLWYSVLKSDSIV